MKTVIALFENMQAAEYVVPELTAAGFPKQDIGLMTYQEGKNQPQPADIPEAQGTEASLKVTTLEDAAPSSQEVKRSMSKGMLVGGILGFILGLIAITLAIPGMGWTKIVAPLITTLVGAGLGSIAGGASSAMDKLGETKDQSAQYTQALQHGNVLVSVKTPEERYTEVTRIMQRHHALDVSERYAHWQAQGEPQPTPSPDKSVPSNTSKAA